MDWMRDNKLKIDPAKMEAFMISRKMHFVAISVLVASLPKLSGFAGEWPNCQSDQVKLTSVLKKWSKIDIWKCNKRSQWTGKYNMLGQGKQNRGNGRWMILKRLLEYLWKIFNYYYKQFDIVSICFHRSQSWSDLVNHYVYEMMPCKIRETAFFLKNRKFKIQLECFPTLPVYLQISYWKILSAGFQRLRWKQNIRDMPQTENVLCLSLE